MPKSHSDTVSARAIVHVDMDAFYASVEQRDRPELRGKPLIVAGQGRRGVVLTASYEARVFGVHSAMPTARARRLCPDGIYVNPRMSRYAAVSADVFAVFAQFTPEIEGLSLDEAFLDVTHSMALLGDIGTIARAIKRCVLERTGLTCSVGMAHNKLLAKLACELGKPDGCFRIDPERVPEVLDPLPVRKLWTVGRVAAETLEAEGIRTMGQLRTTPRARLQRLLGKAHADALLLLARGEDERPVVADREEKSISAENTFELDLETLADARSWAMRLTEKACERARKAGLAARTVTVKLRVPPFETMSRRATLTSATSATADVFAVATRLLDGWWRSRASPRLRLLGISLSGFETPTHASQAELFAPAKPRANDGVLDSINRRFGRGAIAHASAIRKEKGDGGN